MEVADVVAGPTRVDASLMRASRPSVEADLRRLPVESSTTIITVEELS